LTFQSFSFCSQNQDEDKKTNQQNKNKDKPKTKTKQKGKKTMKKKNAFGPYAQGQSREMLCHILINNLVFFLNLEQFLLFNSQ
jgi:hypothetical protein